MGPRGAGLEGIPSLDGRDGPEELREVPHATDATDLGVGLFGFQIRQDMTGFFSALVIQNRPNLS